MPKAIDLTGMKFGKLTVTGRVSKIKCNHAYWNCQCECGKSTVVRSNHLRDGGVKSCGCNLLTSKRFKDIKGLRFGKITVLEKLGTDKNRQIVWRCLCDCGKTVEITGGNLHQGRTNSCGCNQIKAIQQKNTKHGLVSSRIYRIWQNLKSRCLNPEVKCYANYGGRGIELTESWHQFDAFYNDMAATYFDGATIERNDVNGNYEPSNCKWATLKEQAQNRRDNVRYLFNGQMLLLDDISELTGIKAKTIWARINVAKWPLEDAFKTPTLKPTEYHLHKFKSTV